MKILKTLVGTDKGTIQKLDTIEHEGCLWLVPMWRDSRSTGMTSPARIIRLDVLPFGPSGLEGIDYLLNGYIPIAILDGRTPPEEAIGFVVLDNPDIEFRGGTGIQ